jgi:thiazole synthase ThiGH ThiG subunit
MSEPLEPGLYIGMSDARHEDAWDMKTVVRVSGEAPWLKMEVMRSAGVIRPDRIKNLVRIDQLVDHKIDE